MRRIIQPKLRLFGVPHSLRSLQKVGAGIPNEHSPDVCDNDRKSYHRESNELGRKPW